MTDLLALLPEYLGGHLRLTLASLLVSVTASIPLGIVAARRPRLGRVVVAAAGVVQTIPALALLAVMVPLLAALSLPGIGFLPAFLGLTLYGVLPVLNNTVISLTGIDPAVRQAADGVGMTPNQRLWRVELPLALPVIVGGIRTATVWLVGMATLSTPVGATSLGNYIFSGLQTRNFASVLVGCLASAFLAMVLDGMIRWIERSLGQGRRVRAIQLGIGTVVLAMIGGASSLATPAAIIVGAKTFTEQYVLAEVLSQKIVRDTGTPARQLTSLGSTVAFDALRNGEIDLYVDYSGTIWTTILGRRGLAPGPVAVLNEVRERLLDEHGVVVVAALGFRNSYALAMNRAHAERLDISKISDLRAHAPHLAFGADYEFFARPEWTGIRDTYHLTFRERRSMDASLMYDAVASSQVDVISAFTTDGRIDAFDLMLLHDDASVIPPYDAIVLASESALRLYPRSIAAVRALSGSLDDAQMRQMNHAVDGRGQTPREVAEAFLDRQTRPPS